MGQTTPPAPRSARFFGILPSVGWYIFLGYIVLVILLDVAVAPFISYRSKWAISDLGFLFLPLGLILGAVGCLIARKLPEPHAPQGFLGKHWFGLVVLIGCIALFAAQIFIIGAAGFKSRYIDWSTMLDLGDIEGLSAYYSLYPNNQLLGGIFVIMNSVGSTLGIEDPYITAVYGASFSVIVSIGLAAFSARAIGGCRCGLCTFVVMLIFIGLNPYFMIPYSDPYGMLFTTGTIFFWTCFRSSLRWAPMLFIAYLGYSVKPTAAAPFVAAAFVSGCLYLKTVIQQRAAQPLPSAEKAPGHLDCSTTIKALRALGCCIIAGALALVTASAIKDIVDVPLYPNERMVPAHYLMMGFNLTANGMYNDSDIQHSFTYHDPDEMTEADLSVWQSRVKMLGPAGVAELMLKKSLILYNSGDFLFPRQSSTAFHEILGDSPAVQRFYGIISPLDEPDIDTDDPNMPPSGWAYIAQPLWFMILCGIALCLLRRRPSAYEMGIALSLLLLTSFLLLFECSAKYLFLFSPFYVILGVRGWQRAGQLIQATIAKHHPRTP